MSIQVWSLGVHLGKFEEVIHHVAQPLNLAANGVIVASDLRWILNYLVVKSLNHGAYARQRRTQIVRYCCCQLLTLPVKRSPRLFRRLQSLGENVYVSCELSYFVAAG